MRLKKIYFTITRFNKRKEFIYKRFDNKNQID